MVTILRRLLSCDMIFQRHITGGAKIIVYFRLFPSNRPFETNMDFWSLLLARENVLNAGVDLNGCQAVTPEELIENNRRFKSEHPATVVADLVYNLYWQKAKKEEAPKHFLLPTCGIVLVDETKHETGWQG